MPGLEIKDGFGGRGFRDTPLWGYWWVWVVAVRVGHVIDWDDFMMHPMMKVSALTMGIPSLNAAKYEP